MNFMDKRQNNGKKLFQTVLAIGLTFMVFGLVCLKNISNGMASPFFYKNILSGKNGGKATSNPTADKTLNVLVLGTDKDGTRADVITGVSYDPKEKKLKMVSIPRDTKIKDGNKTKKINALYNSKNPNDLLKEAKQITGISYEHYIVIDFDAFKCLIDALDGIEIDVPVDMKYDDPTQNLHIDLKKGKQVLDGNKAEQYVRFRKGVKKTEGYDGGDLDRIGAQQFFIQELLAQKMNVKYLTKAPEILNIMKKHVKTDLEVRDLLPYVSMNMKFSDVTVDQSVVPGEPRYENDAWYYILSKQDL